MRFGLRSTASFFALVSLSGCANSTATSPSDAGASMDATSSADANANDDGADDAGAESEGGLDEASFSISASITIDPTTPLGQIGPGFVGLSYEKSHLTDGFFRGDNAALIAMVDLLGPSVLRVGGNSVDETVWQAFDAGAPIVDATAPSYITSADVDALAAFAKAASWTVLYGVNLKTSSSSVAASEAAYAATALGSALYGFEIGNECDLYSTVASSPGTWNYAAFTSDWDAFEGAMHTSAPSALFTGPASASHYAAWTVPFAKDEASKITLLTQHYYVADGEDPTSTLSLLLSPNPGLVTELQALSTAASGNAIKNGYRLAECNSFYNGGAPGISDAYGTALWAIDFLFTNAKYGSSGVNFHGGGNGTGYTPIADANGAVVGARPLFYGMLLFAKAGTGSMLATSGAPTSVNFSAYAIGAGGRTASVILSNKDGTTSVHAAVDVGTALSSAGATLLTAPALSATTGVTLGGVAIGADGTFAPNAPRALPTAGSTFTVEVPPASAVLIAVK